MSDTVPVLADFSESSYANLLDSVRRKMTEYHQRCFERNLGGVPIETADWMPENEIALAVSGRIVARITNVAAD